MGVPKTPEQLKAKAKKLLERARKIENERYVKLGKIVDKHYKNDFAGFDIERFKQEVKQHYE